jgi:hypothetical protein
MREVTAQHPFNKCPLVGWRCSGRQGDQMSLKKIDQNVAQPAQSNALLFQRKISSRNFGSFYSLKKTVQGEHSPNVVTLPFPAKILAFFVQTAATFCKKNFDESRQKSQKIVVVTSTPDLLYRL